MRTLSGHHQLLVEPRGATTHGSCTCGEWQRDVGSDEVVVTGRSREETLRAAHEDHARLIS